MLDRADLAMFDHGDVALFTLDGDRLTKLATYHVGDGQFGTLGWADRGHLFAAIERTVVMIDGSGMTPVAVPDDATLTAPKPAIDDVVASDGIGRLVVTDGAAWWSHCVWGYPYDGFQCTTYVEAQLWPGTTRTVDAGALTPVTAAWADASPAGYRVAHDEKAFTCMPPNGAATTLASDHDGDLADVSHWVSADPPRLLVAYGQFGYADMLPTRWTLHAGCAPEPIASGTSTQLGNRGLWIGTDGDTVAIWRAGKRLGELPSSNVAFRP